MTDILSDEAGDEAGDKAPTTRSSTPHPLHPRHLLGSKWSSAPETRAFCHWEVIEHRKKSQEIVLRATLDPTARVVLPWRALRDRDQWTPGWR